MNKGKITYRFNPDGSRVLKEDEQQLITLEPDEAIELPVEAEEEPVQIVKSVDTHDGQYLNQFTNDFGAWSSPFETETEKLEKLIRESDQPSNVGQAERAENDDRYDDRPLLDYEPAMDDLSDHPFRYIRRSSKAWLKFVTSFTGAVVTGLILGILVLSFFSSEDPPVDALPDSNVPGPNIGAPADDVPVDEQPNGQTGDPLAIVNVPAESYVLLQNGVFSTREAASAAIANLREQGFAAAMLEGDQYFVFAAVLNNRDDALALSQVLQSRKFETFIKTLELDAITEIHWTASDAEEIEAYFTGAHRLVQMMIDFSAIHLQNGASSPLEKSSIEAVRNVHQSWNMAASSLVIEDEAIKPLIERMNNELNTAVLSLEEYHKSPAASYQWQIQHSILQFLLQYAQLTNRT